MDDDDDDNDDDEDEDEEVEEEAAPSRNFSRASSSFLARRVSFSTRGTTFTSKCVTGVVSGVGLPSLS